MWTMWNRAYHTDEENERWCRLRAAEWGVLPAYLAQPLVPVLLLAWPFWKVLLGVLIAQVLWAAVRYHAVSVGVAHLAWAFVSTVKGPTSFIMAVYFACRHDYLNATICVGWFCAGGVTGLFPAKAQRIQKMLMAKLKFELPGWMSAG